MAPGGGYHYTPLPCRGLFLIDHQIPEHVHGPHFNFQPYHYGPFDRSVYDELDRLAMRGLVSIDSASSPRTFALTTEGGAWGTEALESLQAPIRDFVIRTSYFVRNQTFSSLVSAIYKAFPEMRANSVFQS